MKLNALNVSLFIVVASSMIGLSKAEVLTCSSVDEIRAAMAAVKAGDEILIEPGTYRPTGVPFSGSAAHFASETDGAATARITMKSSDPNNRAILEGEDVDSKSVIRIFGNYWTLEDLVVTNADKGIIFDNADYGEILNCEVYGTGKEAIHIRDGSDHCLIEDCVVHDTGLDTPGFGEAIYIGTDKSRWDDYDPFVWNTVVRGCTLGPGVTAEAFDIKEGTRDTIIEHNVIDARGLSGDNYADSFIDLKGTRTYVRYNTFYQNGESKLDKGVAIVDRGVEMSSYEHVIHDNIFHLDDPNVPMVNAHSGTDEIYAFDNTRNPSDGDDYKGGVDIGLPSWYDADPSNPTTPTPIQQPTPPAPTPAPTPPNNSGSGWSIMTYDDFEAGWGNYVSGGRDAELYEDGEFAHQGSNAIRIQDDLEDSRFYYTANHDVSSYNNVRVSFWFLADDMDKPEEGFKLEYMADGVLWTTADGWYLGTDFENDQYYHVEVLIDSSSMNSIKIGFVCDGSSNSDGVFIDEILVEGA